MSLASVEQAIPPGGTILLDSTVVIAYFKGNELVSQLAKHIIETFVETGRNPAILSSVSALELLVDPMRRQDDELYRSVMFFLVHTRHLKVLPVGFDEAHEAAHLRATYNFRAPDALIIATGYRASVTHFVCNDEEWKQKLPPQSDAPSVCYLSEHLPFP